jgi:anti-sigma regulatory factor (Ser/Thr protein kinase)
MTSRGARALRLAALPTAPRIARAFVAEVIRAWHLPDGFTENAELLISELVTNAARHVGRVDGTPTPRPTEHVAVIYVRLLMVGALLRLEVWDSDRNPPMLKALDVDAEGGRGLFLVASLSVSCGSYAPRAGGKIVWCELAADEKASVATSSNATATPLPKRVRQTTPAQRQVIADVAMLERVLWGHGDGVVRF